MKTRSLGMACWSRQVLRQAGDDRRLAGGAHLVAWPEPVPAGHGIVATGLRRIDDEQPVLFGEGVHPGPAAKSSGLCVQPCSITISPCRPSSAKLGT